MMSNFNIFILIIMSMIFLLVSGQQQDDLCPTISNVLCVKDILLDISSATKDINEIIRKIEQYIHRHDPFAESLDGDAQDKMKRINLSSKHHYQLMNTNNNINRTGFIDLIKEENDAFSYLYNSINNILKFEKTFGKSINKFFQKILIILRKNILCNYRNILHVYSETWTAMDDIKGIQILKTRKRTAPSILHHTYSILVTKLLKEWMKNVNDFVINIESKFLR